MASTHQGSLDDDADESVAPQRTLDDLAEELTGELLSPVSEDAEEDARLTEEELEAAVGVQSPPGRIE